MPLAKLTIVLARKTVPNYWEIKIVDQIGDDQSTTKTGQWHAVPHSASMGFGDIERALTQSTVIDVTKHFKPLDDLHTM